MLPLLLVMALLKQIAGVFWGITDTRNTRTGPYLDLTEDTRKNSTDGSCLGSH